MQDNLIRRNSQLSYENPETWLPKNLPVQSIINTFSAYAVAHEKLMWDSRTIHYGSEPAETSSLIKCKTVFIITICRLNG